MPRRQHQGREVCRDDDLVPKEGPMGGSFSLLPSSCMWVTLSGPDRAEPAADG